jgi:hypothetical protein
MTATFLQRVGQYPAESYGRSDHTLCRNRFEHPLDGIINPNQGGTGPSLYMSNSQKGSLFKHYALSKGTDLGDATTGGGGGGDVPNYCNIESQQANGDFFFPLTFQSVVIGVITSAGWGILAGVIGFVIEYELAWDGEYAACAEPEDTSVDLTDPSDY